MAKQEHKILEFHGGSNDKFDARDIAENQNVSSTLSIRKPGRLVKEGDGKTLYVKTGINGHTITDIGASSGGYETGYGLFSFPHDYTMESTPVETDTDFICINDMNGIDIYDPNVSGIGTEIVQDGTDTSTSNWTYRDAGGVVDGWTDANPSVYEDDETASIINTLSGDKFQANINYVLTFNVNLATLNLAIGGASQSTGGSPDDTYVAATNYTAGKHKISFTTGASARTHLWITATTSSAGNGTIDDVSCSISGWTDDKFTLGSRTATVKPEYYNVDGAVRICDSNFSVTATGLLTNKNPHSKNDVVFTIDSGTISTGSIIQINQEIMYVTTGVTSGVSITVIRGYANTNITTHADNSIIYYANVPKYFGHIKQDRLFEAETSNSINTWVEDAQTPQPPNNTRKSDGTTGTLATSNGIQSLRIFDAIEGSTINYPSESEKVNLEFTEGSANTGVIKVDHVGAGILKLTTSGRGSSSTASHQLKSGMMITIENPQIAMAGVSGETDLSNLSGTYEVLSTPSATTFTIQDPSFSSDMDEDATVGVDDTYTATVDGWTDIGGDSGTHEGFVKVSNDETTLPGLVDTDETPFWIHITGQTGVPAFNGIHKAYKIDTDDLRFETSSHASVGDVAGTTEIQQLLAIVRPEDSDAINEDLKRKWNFAMSFTYDGPAQEVQESLLTMGHSLVPVAQTDGTSNLINFEDDELVVDGTTPNSGHANWTVLDVGGAADSWSSAAPPVYQDNETSSFINTLTGDAIDSGERYSLTFTVGTAALELLIGGASDASGSGNLPTSTFVSKATYAAGTHTVTFQADANCSHLWFTAYIDNSGSNATLSAVILKANGYGSGETSIVVDDGTVFSVGEIIYIGTEQLYISGISTHTLTVTRGYNGSTAAHFGNDSLISKMTELSSTQTVDWTNFTGVPSCVIKTVYNHGVDEKTWNARINGFKIYMKDVTEGDHSKEFRLFSHVNFNKGTYTLFSAGDSELILEQPGTWATGGEVCTISTGTDLTIKPIDTYLSENLFTEDTIINAQYKVAEVVGRRVYIGNIRQGGRTYPDRMLRSPTNKFDTFPETNFIDVAVGDGDIITALKSFGDRLLQFKKDKVYVINTSGDSEVLESEYQNAGIVLPSQVVETNIGIAWINPSGLWFFDGKQIQNLTRHLKDDPFADHNIQTGFIAFEKNTNRLLYTDYLRAGVITKWYVFDLELKANQSFYYGDILPHSNVLANKYTNFVNDSSGNMIFGYVDASIPTKLNFYQWDNDAAGGQNFVEDITYFKSKDIDFGSPTVKKKIYKVYITYKCRGTSGVYAKYSTNGNTALSAFSDSTTLGGASVNYSSSFGGFQDSYDTDNSATEWQVAELKPLSSISNAYSFQLHLYSSVISGGVPQPSGVSTSPILFYLDSGLGSTDYTGWHIYLWDGAGKYNQRRISTYVTGSQVAVVDALTDRGYGDITGYATSYLLGVMADDFEINDITIIFRPKRVK